MRAILVVVLVLVPQFVSAIAVRDSGTTPLLWAAGYDHSLELLAGGRAKFHVISGAGFVRSPTTVKCSVAGGKTRSPRRRDGVTSRRPGRSAAAVMGRNCWCW